MQELSNKVGKNLKKLIKQSIYKTQEKFAINAMNVDPVTVRRWIKNGVKDIDTIYELSKKLNVELFELLK